MKSHLVFFLAAAAILCTIREGGVDATQSDGGTPVDIYSSCLLLAENEWTRHAKIVESTRLCLADDVQGEYFNHRDVELLPKYFKNYCQNASQHLNCLDHYLDMARLCLKPNHQLVVESWHDLLAALSNAGCEHDGELLTKLYAGFVKKQAPHAALAKCVSKAEKNNNHTTGPFTPGARFVAFYRNLGQVRGCMLEGINSENGELTMIVTRFIDEIKSHLKCLPPEDNILVPCFTLPGSII